MLLTNLYIMCNVIYTVVEGVIISGMAAKKQDTFLPRN